MKLCMVLAYLVAGWLCVYCGDFYKKKRSGLTEIPDDIPQDAIGVYLSNNKITTVPPNAFSSLSHCIHINLEMNRINSISPGAFRGLSILWQLNLDFNSLEEIRGNMWEGLASLESLTLFKNNISFLHPGAFEPLTNLSQLILSKNKISEITADMWNGLSSLTNLNLDFNSYEILEDDIFTSIPTLTHLYLSYSSLREISTGTFRGLGSISWLMLNANNLRFLPVGSMSGLPVRHLWMNGNQFTTLSSNIFQNPSGEMNHSSKVEISLERNPIVCDWRLCWMKKGEQEGWLTLDYAPTCENMPDVEWDELILDCVGVEELQKAYDIQQALAQITGNFQKFSNK